MSGFEIVGVVLGVVPLLISGLEHYKDGLVPIKDMLRYEEVVKEHIRALNIARSRLRNTCEKLLNGLVDDEEISLLLNSTALGGDTWKRTDLDRKLQERLDRSYEGYMATIAHLAQTIVDFGKMMGLDSKFRAITPLSCNPPTWIERPDKKRKRDIILGDELKRRSIKLWKRVKLGLDHEEFDDLINKMAHENLQLEILTQGNLELEPIRRERSRQADTKYWKAVRHFASSLHGCLMHWPCQCRLSHQASLRLDIPTSPKDDEQLEVNFGVIFQFGKGEGSGSSDAWRWRDTEIKSMEILQDQQTTSLFPAAPTTRRNVSFMPSASPVPSRTPSPVSHLEQAAKIVDLCAIFGRQIVEPCCLGYLDDEHWQHHVYLSTRQQVQQLKTAISLHQILSAEPNNAPVVIKPKDRYETALLLSLTILQLYNTPWLSDNWTRNDIYLLNDSSETSLAKKFYVSKSFSPSQGQPIPNFEIELALLRNASVFNLGLALLELTYGHPIEYYQTPRDLTEGQQTVMTNKLIALRLLRRIDEYEGKRYGDVVSRCIHCDFATRLTSFENDDFRQNFYSGVVEPLQAILNDFVK